jgi:hypothetical protein
LKEFCGSFVRLIGNRIGEFTFVFADALNLLLLAFLPVTIYEISKKIKIICNSLILFTAAIHIFFMRKKLRSPSRVIMTYIICKFFVLAYLPYQNFLKID